MENSLDELCIKYKLKKLESYDFSGKEDCVGFVNPYGQYCMFLRNSSHTQMYELITEW